MNFYKKNKSNIIVHFNYSCHGCLYDQTRNKTFIFFDKNKNIEIFSLNHKSISNYFSEFSFSVNKNIPESEKINTNLHYDFYGILKYKFNFMLSHFLYYACNKQHEYDFIKKSIEKIEKNNLLN